MKMNQQHRVLANRDGAARVRNAIVHADDTVALVLVQYDSKYSLCNTLV